MDLKTIIAAAPFLRRLWRWLPGPLKVVALALAAVVAARRLLSDEEEPAPHGDGEPTGGSDRAA